MKRDMELIKLLLEEYEGEEPKPDLSAYSEEAQIYHTELMEEAGLIVASFQSRSPTTGIPHGCRVERLTNAGHDFLEAARNETIWKKFREATMKHGAAFTIPLAIEWLKAEMRRHLGMSSSE